jgi:hypoxanthine phosphoribosyltransferase
MRAHLDDMNAALAEADCLKTEAEVEAALHHMAQAITARLAESDPIVLCVMNGGLIVTGKLLPLLHFPLQTDYVHATRYGEETSGGKLLWIVKPALPMKGRTVLIVDDILDEGHTLAEVIDYCRNQGAREVLTAILINKAHERKARPGLAGDFVGMEVEDRFLFGYGMDYKGYWRNAPGIYAVKGL